MESQEPNTKAPSESPVAKPPTSKRPMLGRLSKVRNEALLAFVAIVVTGCLVVIPRPTYPQIVPLPHIDSTALKAREQLEIRRALEVRDGSLDKEARAIGEQVRRLGARLASGARLDPHKLETLRKDARQLTEREKSAKSPAGTEALFHLRALQGQMFLQAVDQWQSEKEVSSDLKELGGPFYQIATSGWLNETGQLLLTDDELRLFFRVHWGKITGLDRVEAFELSLEEKRRYYSTNLRHPANPLSDLEGRARTQLGYAVALGKVDPNYPSQLARGIFLLRMGDPINAIEAFEVHLGQRPNGPWAQIARNHLISAVQKAGTFR